MFNIFKNKKPEVKKTTTSKSNQPNNVKKPSSKPVSSSNKVKVEKIERNENLDNSLYEQNEVLEDFENNNEDNPSFINKKPKKRRVIPAYTPEQLKEAFNKASHEEDGENTINKDGKDIVLVEDDKYLTSLGQGKNNFATEDEISEILNFSGEVYTASKGTLKLDNKQRAHAAALGNGIFLISKDSISSHAVYEIKEAIRQDHRKIKKELIVDPSIIRKVHENYDRRISFTSRTPRMGNSGEPMQKMQFEFLKIVREASEMRCSDIHIFVLSEHAYIQVRRGGIMEMLREYERVEWASDLCATAFNMADNSESQYKPLEFQDARISKKKTQTLPDNVQGLRLHFNPLSNGGRHLVARLLYETEASDIEKDVDTLGYTKRHVEIIRKMRRKPFGINIISGPTGSGKSTTLQRSLNSLLRERRRQINILTIEDPPEYDIPGAAQIPVNTTQNESNKTEAFTNAIAAAMRSDPDVIMIGEIRTKSSASLAFTAAMTGHQVWASLHANDAISILDRLRDLEVDIFKLTDHTLVTGLVGQRLVRKVCPHCALNLEEAKNRGFVSEEMERDLHNIAKEEFINNIRFTNPDGCKLCNEQGISGREVVAECLIPDSSIMRMIRDNDKEGALEYWMDDMAGLTILEHAIQKMVKGICDPRDLEERVGGLGDFNLNRRDVVFSPEFME